MRGTERSQFIAFRADPKLLGALQEHARLAGVSVSELLRCLVRDNILH